MGITISHRVRTDICEAARFNSRRLLMERDATVAKAGERQTKTTITMNTNTQLTVANRKQLTDFVGNSDYNSLRSRTKNKLNEKRDALRESLVVKFAKEKGAFQVLAHIKGARKKLKEQEDALTELGFVFYDDDDNDVRLIGDAGEILRNLIDSEVDKELGTVNDLIARFDDVQLAMMTVASLEEADKLLKSVSSI